MDHDFEMNFLLNPTCHASYSDGTPSKKLRELLSENPWLEDETFVLFFSPHLKGYVMLCLFLGGSC